MSKNKPDPMSKRTSSPAGARARRSSNARAAGSSATLPLRPSGKNLDRFIVVAYDISDNKRRTRLHKALRRFGEPVQKSVFECLLDDNLKREMRKRAGSICGNPEIELRCYELCAACRKKIRSLGCGETTTIKRAYVL